mmetsp:Transcript_13426/g.25669  ORF Transcript_13426/g.25669 Transcript_13426/m.25669 type:complete len:90 (-) Transcript_13426:52-321(-)
MPLKKPVTNAVFSAIECDLRVPSSNINAMPLCLALAGASTAASARARSAVRPFGNGHARTSAVTEAGEDLSDGKETEQLFIEFSDAMKQ